MTSLARENQKAKTMQDDRVARDRAKGLGVREFIKESG